MKSANRELVDRLAAEYVLGTLRGRARRRFERWLLSPQVSALVNAWEKGSRASNRRSNPSRRRPPCGAVSSRSWSCGRWRAPAMRWLAIAASVMFFAMLGVFAWREIGTPQLTQRSVLQADAQTIYWSVEILGQKDDERQEISLHVQQIHELPPGKSHELWALPEGGAPVSLGLLPHTGDHHRVLTAAQRAALGTSKQIAVSLEPEGGSPTGAPTEVLFAAPLQAV